MSNGFLSSSPGARHGTVTFNSTTFLAAAQKFTCPGTGTVEISEIGVWLSADASNTHDFALAIFTHDAANNNPDTLVANSDTGAMAHATTTVTKKSYTYPTKPQLTGGQVYWLIHYSGDAVGNIDYIASGGGIVYFVHPDGTDWPTPAQWDTGTDAADVDMGIYVVYSTPHSRDIADNLGVSDDRAVTKSVKRFPEESLGVTDATDENTIVPPEVPEEGSPIGVIDAIAAQIVSATIINIAESLGPTDSLFGAMLYRIFFSDNAGAEDVAGRSLGSVRYPADVVGNLDTLSKIINIMRLSGDNLGLSDSISRQLAFLRTLYETLTGVADEATTFFTDSWEAGNYNNWTVGEKYGGGDWTPMWTVQSGNLGGSGSYYLRGQTTNSWSYLGHELGGDYGQIYVKLLAQSSTNMPTGGWASANCPILVFRHGTAGVLSLTYGQDDTQGDFQKWKIYRGGVWFESNTLLATSASTYDLTTARQVEIFLVVDSTSGVCKVWIDGNLAIDFTGDTAGNSATHTDRIDLGTYGGPYGAQTTTYYDDLELKDGIGGEAVGFDSASRTLMSGRSLSDPLSVTDALLQNLVQGLSFVVAESLGVTDSPGLSLWYVRPFMESLSITDYRTLVNYLTRSASDSVSTSDTARLIKQLVRSMSDTANVSDVIEKISLIVLLRALAESVSVDDDDTQYGVHHHQFQPRNPSEQVGVADARTLTKMMIRGIADSEGVEDYIAKISGVYRGLSEAVSVPDAQSILSTLILLVNMADVIGVSDSRAWARQFGRIVEATVGMSDFIALSKAMFRSAQSPVGLIDTTGGGQALMRAVYENIGVTEFTSLLIIGFAYELYLSESLSTVDLATRVLASARSVSDACGVSDFDEMYKQVARYIGEDVGLTDTAQAAFLLARTIADQLGISDELTSALNLYMDHFRSVSDNIGVEDSYYYRVFITTWLTLILASKRMIFVSSCQSFLSVAIMPSAATLSSLESPMFLKVIRSAITLEVENA